MAEAKRIAYEMFGEAMKGVEEKKTKQPGTQGQHACTCACCTQERVWVFEKLRDTSLKKRLKTMEEKLRGMGNNGDNQKKQRAGIPPPGEAGAKWARQ
jgi:hypothetical protein